MKRLIIIIWALATALSTYAQVPQKMSYQAVIRDASNTLIQNKLVGIKISILRGSATGQLIYTETQNPQTNSNGLVSIEIGGGQGFDAIGWADGPYFIMTEADPSGGAAYSITTVSQLLSVPYALHAKTADNGFSGNYLDLTNKPLLFSGNYTDLTNKPLLFSGDYLDLLNKPVLFDGKYNSLSELPVLFDGNYTSLANRPVLSTLASSGSYNDLLDKPSLFSGSYTDLTDKPVLFGGSWNDLTGKPSSLSGFGILDAMSTSHPANSIGSSDIINWTTAYGWGDHSKAGYLTSFTETDPKIGPNSSGYLPKWNGSAMVSGSLFQDEAGNLGIGTTTPRAAVDITSVSGGILIPRMTTAERDLISSPAMGLQIYNISTSCFNVWNGSSWGQICPDCGFDPSPGNNGPICAGLTLELTAVTISGAAYSWTGPNGFSSSLQNPSIPAATVAASGAYFVTATRNGCTSQPVATVATVTPSLGTASASYNSPVCVGRTLNLSATSIPGASYTWSGPGNFFSNIQNPSIPNVLASNAGTYYVAATVGNCTTTSSVSVTIDPVPAQPGPISGTFSILPPASGVAFSVAPVSGASSYTWSYSGSGVVISGQGTNSVTLNFACGASAGTLSVTANNVCGGAGTAQSQSVMVSALAQPGTISGNTSVIPPAAGAAYSILPVTGATSYTWSVPASLGTIITGQGTSSITVDFACGASAGLISVAAVNSCGTGPSRSLGITVSTLPTPGTIIGSGTITYPQTGVPYSVPAVSGATTYTWTVPSGAVIASGQGSNSILVDYACGAGSGSITVTAGNTCGNGGSNSKSVTVTTSAPAMPGAVSGTNNLPAGTSAVVYNISAVTGATSYLWSAPTGATVIAGQGTTSVTVDYSCQAVSGNISVSALNGCGASAVRTFAVTVNAAPSIPGLITGVTSVPAGSNNVTYSVATVTGATGYTWSYSGSGATFASGQGTNTIMVNFDCAAVSGAIKVTSVNACGVASSERTLNVTIAGSVAAPGSISGPVNPLKGQVGAVYSVAPVTGAATYIWTVPSGVNISSGQGTNSISADFGCAALSGSFSVLVNNICVTGGTSPSLTVTPGTTIGQPGTITGSSTVPQGKTDVTFSIAPVSGATTYTWSYSGSGATIKSGQGTPSITVDFSCSSTSGNIAVTASNACISPGTAQTFPVTVSAISTPGTISGPASLPQGTTGAAYSVAAIPGATSYNWIVPVGATVVNGQGTNSILVDFDCTVGNGNILVTANNSCGSSGGSSLNTTITASVPANPGAIGISTSTTVPKGMKNVMYTIAPVTGATAYNWVVPAGAVIVSGQGSTSIVVDYSCAAVSGNVTVAAANKCGTGTASTLAMNLIAAPSQPGSITGTAAVPKGSSGFVYSAAAVQGATLYTWNVPAGAVITSGQGTTSITVDYSCSAVSGNITVNASNACGTASANTVMAVTIGSSLAALGSITGSTSPVYGQTGVVYSITPVSGASLYTWSVPGTAVISSGQGTSSIKVDFPCNATNGSILVTAGNGCSSTSPVSLSFALSSTPPVQPGAITGPTSVPLGSGAVSYSIAAVNGATYYSWTVPPGAVISSGQGTASITADFSSCSCTSGNVSVMAGNTCLSMSPAQSLAVTVTNTALSAPGTITGLQTPVPGQNEVLYSISPVAGATSYTWSYSGSGVTITSGQGSTSVIVNYACNASQGNLNVTAANACLSASVAQSLAITPSGSPATPSAVKGSQSPKYGQTGLIYTANPVMGASAYNWTVPEGVSIVMGQGTPAITVDFSCTAPSKGTITVTAGNSCGTQSAAAAISYAMAGTLLSPGTISGLTSVVKGTPALVYSVSPVQGASSYSWSVPSGVTILSGQGTSSITTDYSCTAASGLISVTCSNSCETTAASTLAITVTSTLPLPGTITGSATPGTGSALNYSIIPVLGASEYNWTAPSGATITSGAGTNSVWYQFTCGASSGNITVSVSNTCIAAGTASTLAIAPASPVNPGTLGPITETVNPGSNSRSYSVAPVGYSVYTWSVPEGMTVLSGQGTPAITTGYSGAVTGTVSVAAANSCLGQGSTSTLNISAGNGLWFFANGTGQYGTIQTWKVPEGVTRITIETWGAQGGTLSAAYPGGAGARMKGTFVVTPGQVLKLLVGQAGISGSYPSGGGGTFVTDEQNRPLIVAGGGGVLANPGLTSTSGGGIGAGTGGSGSYSQGGGGFYSDGAAGSCSDGGKSFMSGGNGGSATGSGAPGGFGGGGGSGRTGSIMSSCSNYGSGGGYSGGAGNFGGGSYNSGSNQDNTAGAAIGDGKVFISW